MTEFYQGDIVKISGYKFPLLIISKNLFIEKTGVFHVCPILSEVPSGPLHIRVQSKDTQGTAICEQLKLIDPMERSVHRVDRISYANLIDISDAVQGMFEYD